MKCLSCMAYHNAGAVLMNKLVRFLSGTQIFYMSFSLYLNHDKFNRVPKKVDANRSRGHMRTATERNEHNRQTARKQGRETAHPKGRNQ